MNTVEELLYELIVMKINAFDQHDISSGDILNKLEIKTNKKFGDDVERWISWYFDTTNEENTAFIKGAYGIYKARKKFEMKRNV